MTSKEGCRYRGYEIVPRRRWSQWCVSVHPLRSDLPILSRSTLHAMLPHKEDAVEAARRRIDRLLAQFY